MLYLIKILWIDYSVNDGDGYLIIWINGTFGAGKTTVAYELQKRLAHAMVYDPERFGYALMANIPQEILKDDFQDYSLWREANYALLKQLSKEFKGIIIVPMTLSNEQYFDEMIGRLNRKGVQIKHYTLSASTSTIQKRLAKRFDGKKSWGYQQMEVRIACLSKEIFAEHIQTDTLSIDQVVQTIASRSGVKLLTDDRSSIRKYVDRLRVQLKEIGWFK